MNEIQKQNDIMVTLLSNPGGNITPQDLLKSNLTIDNTLLLNKDEYKNLKFILSKFSENGVFNEEKFNEYYLVGQLLYSLLDDDFLMQNLYDVLEYSQSSFFRPEENIKSGKSEYRAYALTNNPLQLNKGIRSDYYSDPELTIKEVALSNKIWDPKLKKWLNETPESRSLLDKFFGPTLEYAKYTTTGELKNPITGQIEYHEKGEFIRDENGQYFTQLLTDQEIGEGREVVKLADTLTKEGSILNLYDFFDSDGVEKSTTGVVVKSLVRAIPYFIPYVKTPYTVAQMIIGLGQNLPQFVKSAEALFENKPYTELSETSNQIINFFSKYGSSVSEKGQKDFFSAESIGNLLSDVVGQLYSQRMAASLANKLYHIPKLGENGATVKNIIAASKDKGKLATNLGLAYMAITLAGDVYQDTLASGFDNRTAGVVTLLSAAGLYKIMQLNAFSNLSTWFLGKGAGYDPDTSFKPLATLAKHEVKTAAKLLDKLFKGADSTSKFDKTWLSVFDKLDQIFRIGGSGLTTHMLTEGVEEVTEEAVQDGIKGLVDALSALGFNISTTTGSFGGWDNVFSKQGLSRYFLTFVGGALGGGVFHGIEAAQKKFDGTSPSLNEIEKGMALAALRGEGAEFKRQLKVASKFISDRFVPVPNEDGTFDPTNDASISQRDYIVNVLTDRYDAIEALVNSWLEGSDFYQQNKDFKELLIQTFLPKFKSTLAEEYITRRYTKTIEDLVSGLQKINSLTKQIENSPENAVEDLKKQLKEAQDIQKEKIATFKQYGSGQSYVDNLREGQFVMNENLILFFSAAVLPVDIFYELMLKPEHHTESYYNLTSSAKAEVDRKYQLYQNLNKTNIDDLVDLLPVLIKALDHLSDSIKPGILQLINNAKFHTVIKKTLDLMKLDYSELEEQIKALNYEEILRNEDPSKWEGLSDAQKELEKKLRLSTYLDTLAATVNPDNIATLIAADPNSLTNMSRYMLDYALALEKAEVIHFGDKVGEKQKKIVKSLINNIFANAAITTFTKEQVTELLTKVDQEIRTENSPFRQAILQNLEDEELLISSAWRNTDKDMSSLFKMKVDAIKQQLEENGIILQEYYEELLSYFNLLDDKNKNIILKHPNGDSILRALLLMEHLDVEWLYTHVNGNGEAVANAELEPLLSIPGVTPELLLLDKDPAKREEKKGRISNELFLILKDSITHSQAWSHSIESDRIVDHHFKNSVEHLAIAFGTDAKTAIRLGQFLLDQIEAIRDGKGDAAETNLSSDLIAHLDTAEKIIETLSAIITMASPGKKINGLEIRGINLVRKDLLDARGKDSSDVLILDESESEVLQAILHQMSQKITNLKIINTSLVNDGVKALERLRDEIIDKLYQLYVKLNSNTDDKNKLLQVVEQWEYDEELTTDLKYAEILTYKQKLYEKFLQEKINGKSEENLIDELIDILYTKQLDLTIFQLGSDLTVALGNNDIDDKIHAQVQFLLNDLVGLLSKNCLPAKIHAAVSEVFTENTEFYPRQDLAYDVELAVMATLGNDVYNVYMQKLEKLYKDNPNALIKKYIHNYIRIPGPAGSGKTALWKIYIKTLNKLNVKPENIIGTAHTDKKVQDLTKGLKDVLPEANIQRIYDLFPELKAAQDLFKDFEKVIYGDVLNTEEDADHNKTTVSFEDYANRAISSTQPISVQLNDIQFLFHKSEDNQIIVSIVPASSSNSNPHISTLVEKIEFPIDAEKQKIDLTNKVILYQQPEIKRIAASFIPDITNGILMLDECTNLSNLEGHVLDLLAKDKNLTIFGTGDGSQEGYFIQTQSGTVVLDDDSFLGLNLPALKSIYRLENSAQLDNITTLKKLENKAIEALASKLTSFEGLYNYIFNHDVLKLLKEKAENSQLIYSTTSKDGFAGSLMTDDDSSWQSAINTIKDKKNLTILGIVSDTKDETPLHDLLISAGFEEENITLIHISDIKGSEADYAIGYNLLSTLQVYNDLKRLNTLVTRGKKGFIGKLAPGVKWSFNIKYVESAEVKPIEIKRSDDDSGNMWNLVYAEIVKSIEVTQPEEKESTNEETENGQHVEPPIIPQTKLETTPINIDTNAERILYNVVDKKLAIESSNPKELNSEHFNEKLGLNISTAFGNDQLVVPVHTYGFRTGKTFDEMEGFRDTTLDSYQPTKFNDFDAVMSLFKSTDISKMVGGNDYKVLLGIIMDAQIECNNIHDMYIYFINACRKAIEDGKISRVALHVSNYTQLLDFPYLKPNNEEPDNLKTVRRFGITVTANNKITGIITLGTVGFMSFGEDLAHLESQLLDLLKLSEEKPIILEYNKDIQILENNQTSFYEYQVNTEKINKTDKTHINSGYLPYTSVRGHRIKGVIDDLKTLHEFNKLYFDQTLLNYNRCTLDDILKMGWVLDEDLFEIKDPNLSNLENEFFNWYSSFRWSDLSEKGKNSLRTLLTHPGKFIVVHALGDPTKKMPIYIQQVTDWNTWFKNTTESSKLTIKNAKISGYLTIFLLSALATITKYKYSTFDELYDLVSDESKWRNGDLTFDGLNDLINHIASETGINKEILTHLKNSFLLKAAVELNIASYNKNNIESKLLISVNNSYSQAESVLKNLFTNTLGYSRLSLEEVQLIIPTLSNIANNYAYTYIDSTTSKAVCNYGFEPPHMLFNISAYKLIADKETESGSSLVIIQSGSGQSMSTDSEFWSNLKEQDLSSRKVQSALNLWLLKNPKAPIPSSFVTLVNSLLSKTTRDIILKLISDREKIDC